MKKLITFFCLIFSPSFAFAQLQFLDGFENYNAGQQLACQNPTEWTTWNLMPCDSAEDPYISTNQAFGGTKSVLVSHSNDPVKQLGNFTFGPSIIFFQIYVSNNTTGYFGIQNVFEPPSNFEWGLECYFNPSGQGILKTGFLGSNQLNFNYEYDTWLMIKIIVNIDFGDSYFWMNDNLLHTWDWSDNGLLAKQLASIDFFGFSDTEMYIDDFFFQFDYCLSCPPPNPPVNLTAQTINNPNPMVQLNWQDNSNDEYIFEILRKKGNASVPGIFEFLSRVSFDETTFFDSTVIEDSTYTYGIRAYNVYGYSDTSNFATITVEPVPVELVSFTVDVINNNVQLNWTTATETNNSGFEIQRTSPFPSLYQGEGGEAGRGWETIGFIPGHGTTTEPQFYSFNDESLSSGTYKYRLKQIDFDGSFEYTQILEVIIESPKEFSLSQNYPNPFNPITKIKYQIPLSPPLLKGESEEGGLITLKVYDVLGNEITTLVNEEKPAGEYEVEFNGTDLPSGIYFYQLMAGDFIKTQKMVLMK